MSRIYKPNCNPQSAIRWYHSLVIRTTYKALHEYSHVHPLRCTAVQYFFPACASSLTITPFCLEHLDVCTVTKHDITQLRTSLPWHKSVHLNPFLHNSAGRLPEWSICACVSKNQIQFSRCNQAVSFIHIT